MRLVSALYDIFHPFDSLSVFTDSVVVSSPDDLKEGDCLLLWGGTDIPVQYYNKGRSSKSGAPLQPTFRDRAEWALLHRAHKMGIPVIGVCRGAQMLCAAAGGWLVQHVTNHGWNHDVKTKDGYFLNVNSVHHQMMMPDGTDHELLAWSKENQSNVYYDEDKLIDVDVEPELIKFNDFGIAVQWHPEYLSVKHSANEYLLEYLQGELRG
jgi:putative glutamine amidotransferase